MPFDQVAKQQATRRRMRLAHAGVGQQLGAAIIAASGLFVIWREHLLGLERPRLRVRARTAGWG